MSPHRQSDSEPRPAPLTLRQHLLKTIRIHPQTNIAIAGISPFSIGNTVHLQSGSMDSSQRAVQLFVLTSGVYINQRLSGILNLKPPLWLSVFNTPGLTLPIFVENFGILLGHYNWYLPWPYPLHHLQSGPERVRS